MHLAFFSSIIHTMEFNRIVTPLALLSVLAVVSCSKVQENDLLEESIAPQRPLETKVVRLSDAYSTTAFQVKFETVPTPEMLSALLEDEGIASVEPLFVSRKDRKELEHQFGLDRWYEITLAEGADVHQRSAMRPVWLPWR